MTTISQWMSATENSTFCWFENETEQNWLVVLGNWLNHNTRWAKLIPECPFVVKVENHFRKSQDYTPNIVLQWHDLANNKKSGRTMWIQLNRSLGAIRTNYLVYFFSSVSHFIWFWRDWPSFRLMERAVQIIFIWRSKKKMVLLSFLTKFQLVIYARRKHINLTKCTHDRFCSPFRSLQML